MANAIGAELFDRQQWSEAEPYYRRAAKAAELTGDDANVAFHAGNLGNLLVKAGKAADSIPVVQSAIESYEKCGDTDWQAWMLITLGTAQTDTGDTAGAMTSYDSAAKLGSKSQNHVLQSTALDKLASAKADSGDVPTAVMLREEAVKFSLLTNDGDLVQGCVGRLLEDLLRCFPRQEVPAWYQISLGKIQIDLENHADAEDFFRKAVAAAQTTSNPRLQATAYQWLAEELTRSHNLAEAENMLWQQVECASTAGDVEQVIEVYGKVARLLMRRGEYMLALRCWNLQDEQGEHGSISLDTALDRIEAVIELGNWRAAERLLRACDNALENSNDATALARSMRARGEVALLQGNRKDASTNFISALAKTVVDCDAEAVMDVALSMGRCFAAEGSFESERKHASEALEWALRTGDKTREIAAKCLLGSALLADGMFKDALDNYSTAAVTAKELGHNPYWGVALAGAAETYMWLSEFETAHTLLEAAIQIQRRLAQGLDDENSIALLHQQERTYELFQSCLVAEGKTDEALLAGERMKANALAHTLEQRYGSGAKARAMKASLQDAALRVLATVDVGRGQRNRGSTSIAVFFCASLA